MSAVIRRLSDGEERACERILRSLPDWFGIEEAIRDYARDIQSLETWVADIDGEIHGFLTLKSHNEFAAEIQVMAVASAQHGQGLGSRLVARVQEMLASRGVEYLSVKTLAPSHPDPFYERTRGFYRHVGFLPLEENALWGGANPCLFMVKHLACDREQPGAGAQGP